MRKGEAFRKGKGRRKTIKEKVFELVKDREPGISTYGIVLILKIKVHSISGRLSELEQEGLVYQTCERAGSRSCTIWKETPLELIEARKAENWNKRQILWLQKGLKEGFMSQKDFKRLDKQGALF